MNSVAPIAAHLQVPTAQISALLQALRSGGRRVLVVTGAGVSTDSGVPDYRSPGRPEHNPIQHADFVRSEATRKRYWSRSFVGYRVLSAARPNPAHHALRDLHAAGAVGHIVTQNVDGLHMLAGTDPTAVTELHGSIHHVDCMDCGTRSHRRDMQRRLAAINPDAHAAVVDAVARRAEAYRSSGGADSVDSVDSSTDPSLRSKGDVRPDGDMNLLLPGGVEAFAVPSCEVCGGTLKPAVVFFGGTVPRDVSLRVGDLARECDAMLVAGSTLHVWSSFRLARAVADAGKPLAIVNFGPTRADDRATIKVEANVGSALASLAQAWLPLLDADRAGSLASADTDAAPWPRAAATPIAREETRAANGAPSYTAAAMGARTVDRGQGSGR